MRSHQLAKQLLELDDLPVILMTANGFEEVETFVVETENTELVVCCQADVEDVDFGDEDYVIRDVACNDDPSIVLITKSISCN